MAAQAACLCLSHFLLKPQDGTKCQLTPSNIALDGAPVSPTQEGKIWGSVRLHAIDTRVIPQIRVPYQFRLMANYFGRQLCGAKGLRSTRVLLVCYDYYSVSSLLLAHRARSRFFTVSVLYKLPTYSFYRCDVVGTPRTVLRRCGSATSCSRRRRSSTSVTRSTSSCTAWPEPTTATP